MEGPCPSHLVGPTPHPPVFDNVCLRPGVARILCQSRPMAPASIQPAGTYEDLSSSSFLQEEDLRFSDDACSLHRFSQFG